MVNINTVYTTVLYILNKEQRGYITPAEFNSLASQVQGEIFTSYFPDGNQLNRQNQNNTQNDTEFFNMFKDTAYKLYPFEKNVAFAYDATATVLGWQQTIAETVYKLGEIISTYNTTNPQYDSITQLASNSDFNKIIRSKLTAPTVQNPICTTSSGPNNSVLIKVSPQPNALNINCLLKPTNPSWSFTVGTLGQYLYNVTDSVNFQLDTSEQSNLIIQILKYCGIIINDPEIIQAASIEAQEASANQKS
mgnify:FL=1|jgi:hypothetical protein|tara:strand:- start:158 stop:904 length:747 start_codon:yes stop_codon:yes gene_type:complete